MIENTEAGALAENLASEYLANLGYGIIFRNWRSFHKEIDIIAEKDGVLVIVEVKSRQNRNVTADDLISDRKMKNLVDAAEAYIQKENVSLETRFDVIIVTFGQGENSIEHIENAFVPGVNW